jgi:alkylation response protein AidB-like acyl-CoA dehydrogenase
VPDNPEDATSFGARASAWAAANLPEAGPGLYEGAFRTNLTEEQESAEVDRERQLQRMFYEAGFAGVCVPREFGGQGLTPDHQRALNQALAGYEFPARIQVPTFTPCLAILLEFGTEDQKRTHVPAILRGEELWMQLLSEPGGGSDVAGALTSAVRDGDQWPVLIGTSPSIAVSPCSCSPCASRASKSTGSRCSTVRESSARSSSRT